MCKKIIYQTDVVILVLNGNLILKKCSKQQQQEVTPNPQTKQVLIVYTSEFQS